MILQYACMSSETSGCFDWNMPLSGCGKAVVLQACLYTRSKISHGFYVAIQIIG